MLKPFTATVNIIRGIGIGRGRRPYNWPDGIKYLGFTYYPRRADFKDPPYEPTKLFQVRRVKPVKGTPYWERNVLKELKLDGHASDVAIIKNIPEMNQRLWKIKHLVEITPITFPNGFPTKDSITLLKDNGECVVKHLPVAQEKIQALEKIKTDKTRMDGDTLRRDSRKKWLDGWSLRM